MALNKHIALARSAFERNEGHFLPDRCRVERDPQHTADDSMDWNTGDLTPDTPTLIYLGPCSINEAREPTTSVEQGGMESYRQRYRVRLPADIQDIHVGDLLTVVASAGDPGMAETVWRVERAANSSKKVSTRLRIERVIPGESR